MSDKTLIAGLSPKLFLHRIPHIINRHDRKIIEENNAFCTDPEVRSAFYDEIFDEETTFANENGIVNEQSELSSEIDKAEEAFPCLVWDDEACDFKKGTCPYGHEDCAQEHIDCAEKCEFWKALDEAQRKLRDWEDKNMPHRCADCALFHVTNLGACEKTGDYHSYKQKACQFFHSLTENERLKLEKKGPWYTEESGKRYAELDKKYEQEDGEFNDKFLVQRCNKYAKLMSETPLDFYYSYLRGIERNPKEIYDKVELYRKKYISKHPELFDGCLSIDDIVTYGKLLDSFKDRQVTASTVHGVMEYFPLKFGPLIRYALPKEGKFTRREMRTYFSHYDYSKRANKDYAIAESRTDEEARFLIDVTYGIKPKGYENIKFPMGYSEVMYDGSKRYFVHDQDKMDGKFVWEVVDEKCSKVIIDMFYATFWTDEDFNKSDENYNQHILAIRELQKFYREHLLNANKGGR